MVIFVLVLIPLLFTEALPKAQLMMALVAPPPPPPPPPPPAEVHVVKKVQTDIINGALRTPTKIPKKVEMIKEEEAPPPQMSGVVGGVPGGVPGGSMGGVMGGIIGSSAPIPKMKTPERVRVSQGVVSGLKVREVKPVYPPIAKTARVQGNVVLQAEISKEGTIQNLRVLSGPPLLIQSALDAVKQWRYRPYVLNGEPVEVETTITVMFSLTGS